MRKPDKKQPQIEETSRELDEQELKAVSGGWTLTRTSRTYDYGDGPVSRK
jgi:bacteriocin-like protein